MTPTTHRLRVERPAKFVFAAGQHVNLGVGHDEERFLSIASGPEDPYLEFAVRMSESGFKQRFQALRPGDPICLTGPGGRFVRDADRPALLVSGGIGITPLQSMLLDAVFRKVPEPTVLVYGNHNPSDVPFHTDLARLARANEALRVFLTVAETSADWDGLVGRIDRQLLEMAGDGLADPVVYVCGPPGMVVSMQSLILEMGVPPTDLRLEHFGGYE